MKKKIIIYATCQGVSFKNILLSSKELTDSYEIEYFSNFSGPGNSQFNISDKKLNDCDLFLYHHIKKVGNNIDTIDDILSKLKHDSEAIPIPYVTFGAYWPDFEKSPTNPIAKDEQFPYGRIPYRSSILEELIKDNISCPTQEIFDRYLGSPNISEMAKGVLKSDLMYLQGLDSRDSPFYISDYIESNYKSKQLFNIFNHPKKEIYLYLANQLLNHLGMSSLSVEEVSDVTCHVEQNLPIHPSVASGLNIKFVQSDLCYDYLGHNYSFESFIKYYIELVKEENL